MSMTNKTQRRLFYVVQFIELPFKGIDDYVCVPYSWLILRRSSDRKIVVTYPNDEDPFDTKDRVKNKEKPNEEWRFYMAFIKYESDCYKDVEHWIASRINNAPGGKELEISDIQSKLEVDRKHRSGDQFFWSGTHSDKPQLTVNPYNKSPFRKPLPRITIKRPITQKLDKDIDSKRSELCKKDKLSTVTDHAIKESECFEQKQSIVVPSNQIIENDETETRSTSNDLTNIKHSTQPDVTEENESDQITIHFTSTNPLTERQPSPKLTVKQQLSPKLPVEQQLSPKLTVEQPLPKLTVEEPSPKLIVEQPPPKLTVEQQPSPKLSTEQQILPVDQDVELPLSQSGMDLDDSDGDVECTQNDMSYGTPETIQLCKTPPNTLEPVPQPEPVNGISTPLVGLEHSHFEALPVDLSTGKSKEPNGIQKTYHHWFSTTPTTVPTPSCTSNQQLGHQPSILSVSSFLNSKPETQNNVTRNLTEAAFNYHRPCSQELMNGIPSTCYNGFNLKNASPLLRSPPPDKRPPSAVNNFTHPVNKKTRLESITKKISAIKYSPNAIVQLGLPSDITIVRTAQPCQNQLQQPTQVNGSLVNNMRSYTGRKCIEQKVSNYQNFINTPASQNLLELAHRYDTLAVPSQYLRQEDYLQQFARLQNSLRGRETMVQTTDPRVHNRMSMNGGFVPRCQPNPINQPLQFCLQNGHQYMPANGAYTQGVIRHGPIRKPVHGIYSPSKPIVENGVNSELPAHNSSNQSNQNSEHSQQKQDPCPVSTQNDLSLKSKRKLSIPDIQRISKKPRSLSTSKTSSFDVQQSILFQELNLHKNVKSSTDSESMNLAAMSKDVTVEPALTPQVSEAQTMPPTDEPHETQPTSVQSNIVQQDPQVKKTMVDQTTEMDPTINLDDLVDEMAQSLVTKGAPEVTNSTCQTDEWLKEDQKSPEPESASDPETASENEIESENEVAAEVDQTNLTNVNKVLQEAQQTQARVAVEQEMLDEFNNLFTQMGANLACTRNMFNFLRNSMLVCGQTYEKILEKVDKFNLIALPQTPSSSPDNVKPQVPQVTQEKLPDENDKNSGDVNTPKPVCKQRGAFSLPKDYDSNDTKWTLKYRKKKPGLVELMPKTGVYVKKKELKRCIKESNDSKSLARMLLTEVFSKSALSVCSLTGGRAKAFKSVNIDVRPGLDERARMVLLAFIAEHGKKRGWMTNTDDVINSIRTKINEIRAKHSYKCEVLK